jgi:poly(3-hydroxybutyrate) depolymerase
MRLLGLGVLLLSIIGPVWAAGPQTRTFQFGTHQRSYCVYVPETVPKTPPVAVLLHGTNRSGCYVVNLWKKTADRNGVVLVAPDALKPAGWGAWDDPPAMFQAMIEDVKRQNPIDARRLYLFGHSAGGHYALLLGMLESRYFAAVAVFAGALPQNWKAYATIYDRDIPIAMFEGKNDPVVPLSAARETRDLLTSNGFRVEFHELPNTGHTYERYAEDVNPDIWAFLSKSALDGDPEFREYDVKQPH